MRKHVLSLAVAALACVSLNAHAQVIKSDPNTAEAAAERKVDDSTVDERLAQKVTYTSTDRRLHSVIEDISSMTGVTIRCGSGEGDWKVRDLPLVVCANDLQLGVLLRAIADGLHLQLRATRIGDITTYRIYRDKALEQQIENYYQKRRDAYAARAKWEWDAWARLGSMTDEQIKMTPELQEDLRRSDYDSAREFSRVVALGGDELKTRVFSGEKITLKVKDVPASLKEHVSSMYMKWWRQYRDEELQYNREHPEIAARHPGVLDRLNQPDPTDEEMQTACLEIEFYNTDTPGFVTRINGPRSGHSPAFSIHSGLLHKLVPDMPEPPHVPEPPAGDKLDGLQPRDSQVLVDGKPLYEIKFNIKKPEDKDDITLANAVAALAEASGLSVVCDDFESHRQRYYYNNFCFGDSTLSSAISGLCGRMEWLIDGDRKLIVGSSRSWCDRHTRLVPESMVVSLKRKLDGDGVDLDDAVTIRRLTDGQYTDWIYESNDLKPIAWSADAAATPLWRFYDSLSSSDKEKARSEEGLSLARFDGRYLAELFSGVAKAASEQDPKEQIGAVVRADPELTQKFQQAILTLVPDLMTMSDEQRKSIDMDELMRKALDTMPELKAKLVFPTDPDVISRLYLKIKRRDLEPYINIYESGEGFTSVRPEHRPDGFKKHTYSLWIEGENTQRQIDTINLSMPVYSRQREAQLWKEMQKPKAKPTASQQ